tara:strand:- start:1537 stop:3306 length:1770 start_codon:yes stop_codon:yes gene_type:complete
MRILGISCFFHDAAAVLIEDGLLISAAEEERFTRKKHDFNFPSNAINFCLKNSNLNHTDIDAVVFFEKPFLKFERILTTTVSSFPKTVKMFNQSMRTWLFDKIWIKSQIKEFLKINEDKIFFSDHHLSHAASSYYCSPFDAATIVTFDGVGEWATTTFGNATKNKINLDKEIRFPHSIGLLYSAFTAFLGFEVNEGEYKVMGMAPFGTPKYSDKIREVVHQFEDGSIWLNNKYFSFHNSTHQSYTRDFVKLFGKPREPELPFFTDQTGFPSYFGDPPKDMNEKIKFNQYYADIAASIQFVTEEIIIKMLKVLKNDSKSDNLCLSGGVALNSAVNGKIINETGFKDIFIQPAAGDSGGALGAAMYFWNAISSNSKRFQMDHVYWGEEYSQGYMKSILEKYGLRFKIYSENELLKNISEKIVNQKVIGWFQGRFEWGPRSLGNRSILADPRNSNMKDIVNTKIKFREPFRPFAPSVLSNHVNNYFDIPKSSTGQLEKFMLSVVPVKEKKFTEIAAVNHMGTARIQTVYQDSNPLYYGLIKFFFEMTGTPMLLNTSFNVRGEPIVNTPEDAIKTFLNSGIDTLVLGYFVVDK